MYILYVNVKGKKKVGNALYYLINKMLLEIENVFRNMATNLQSSKKYVFILLKSLKSDSYSL